jgi:hypothetical protein
MGDPTRGLYCKFTVERRDGQSAPDRKHDGCVYFVLDLTHDKYAGAALRAYADACEAEYPLLAEDLRDGPAAGRRRRELLMPSASAGAGECPEGYTHNGVPEHCEGGAGCYLTSDGKRRAHLSRHYSWFTRVAPPLGAPREAAPDPALDLVDEAGGTTVVHRCAGFGLRPLPPGAAACCARAGEYNGYGSGPAIFTCPNGCSCHD